MSRNRGPLHLQMEYGDREFAISSGSASEAVTFRNTFDREPAVLVIPNEADVAGGATYGFSAITDTGFTIDVTSSNLSDGDIRVGWVAVEKS